jgi:hypothetical protein
VTAVGHEDSDTEEPDDAELTSSPDTAVSVTSNEGEKSTGDRAKLDHGRDVALDIGESVLVEGLQTETFFENGSVEDTSDETLIDTASSAHEAECEDRKP